MTFFKRNLLVLVVVGFFINFYNCEEEEDTFRFASHYADHMVLQRLPKRAVIWGFGDENATVTLYVNSDRYFIKVYKDWRGLNLWKILLNPYAAGGPYEITAVSMSSNRMKTMKLNDVFFGDVWICGGQSNMVFTVNMSFAGELENTISSNYPHVRLFTVSRYASNATVAELSSKNILQSWSIPSEDTIGGKAWTYFSAVCWMFGRRLFDQYQIPIGLISSNYGGTCVEAWSSPATLSKCDSRNTYPEYFESSGYEFDRNSNSALWNGMIFPLLNTTIFGGIWYQGEQNVLYRPEKYNCTFPAMIQGWRDEWYKGTSGQTDPVFPFGFVQLASLGLDQTYDKYFPLIRWQQTAQYGYVPNDKQKNVFMVVAYDLTDDHSPHGSIHPRDKTTVAERLVMGAQNLAYHEKVYWTGPIFDTVTLYKSEIRIKFRSIGNDGIELRSRTAFEVKARNQTSWSPLPITGLLNDEVIIACPYALQVTNLRYNWKHEPCLYKRCAIYSKQNQLPAPPFAVKIENDKVSISVF